MVRFRHGYSTVRLQYGMVAVRYGFGTLQYGTVTVRHGCGTVRLQYGTVAVRLQYGMVAVRFGVYEFLGSYSTQKGSDSRHSIIKIYDPLINREQISGPNLNALDLEIKIFVAYLHDRAEPEGNAPVSDSRN